MGYPGEGPEINGSPCFQAAPKKRGILSFFSAAVPNSKKARTGATAAILIPLTLASDRSASECEPRAVEQHHGQ
jgi:hypothetical protein